MKLGVDDFLLRVGEEIFLKRIERPLWTFQTIEGPEPIVDPSPESLSGYLKSLVLSSELEIERFLKEKVKPTFKVSLPVLRNEVKKFKREWESHFQKPGVDGESIIWDREDQPLTELYKIVGAVLEKDEGSFVDPDTRTLMIVNRAKTKCRRLVDGRDLSKECAHKIHFKRGTFGKDGFKSVAGYETLPPELMDAMLRDIDKYSGLRELRFFSLSPIALENQLILVPGYYEQTGLYYAGPEIIVKLTFEKITELLSTFPFVDEASLINALGGILSTTFFLDQFAGSHPMALIEGDGQNIGKSTLARVITMIALNEAVRSISFTENDEEFEKRVATEFKNSDGVLIDNVSRTSVVSSGSLERFLTDPILNSRLLGSNSRIQRRNNFQFLMTLNDGKLSPDLVTRSLPILMSTVNQYKMREDFEPLEFVKENRTEILSELAGMVIRWEQAGCPMTSVYFPKYKSWAACINGILEVNGFKGFLSNFCEALVKFDPIAGSLLATAVEEMVQSGQPSSQERFASEWREKLEARAPECFGEVTSPQGRDTQVGKTLKKMRDKFFPRQLENGRVVKIRLTYRDNPSKIGGNSYYSFQIVDGPGNPSGNESLTYGTSAPLSVNLSAPPKTIISDDIKNIFSKGGTQKSEISAEVPRMQAEPTCIIGVEPLEALWKARSQSRAFTYEFIHQQIPGCWWDGSKLTGDLAVDFETTMIEGHAVPEFVMGSVFDGTRLFFLNRSMLKDFFGLHSGTVLIAHNSVFELEVLSKVLEQPQLPFQQIDANRVKDSLLLARLVELAITGESENRKGRFTLATSVKRWLDVELPKEFEIGGKIVRTSYADFQNNLDAAPDAYFHYNAFDTISTFHLWRALQSKAMELSSNFDVDHQLLLSHDIQLKGQYAASLTTRRGIAIDRQYNRQLRKLLEGQIQEHETLLKTNYGFSSGKGSQAKLFEILNGFEQSNGIRFPRMLSKRGGEQISQRENDLKAFDSIPFIRSLLESRSLNKKLQTYVKSLEGVSEVHPRIDILKSTGRISMQNPALQTFPKPEGDLNLRRQIMARNGRVFLISDLVGAELVTLAQTCLDRFGKSNMADAINADQDLHRITASKFFRKKPEELTKDERQYGKIPNFGLPGGMQTIGLLRSAQADYNLNLTKNEVEQLRQAWLEAYPEMKRFLDEGNYFLQRNILLLPYPGMNVAPGIALAIFFGIILGQSETKTSKRKYNRAELEWAWAIARRIQNKTPSLFVDVADQISNRKGSRELADVFRALLTATLPRSGRIRGRCEYTDFCNNAFQGLLADITKEAWYQLHRHEFPVVHVVHDELVCEVSEDQDIEAQKERQESIIISAAKKFCPDVKMRVETKVSKFWDK